MSFPRSTRSDAGGAPTARLWQHVWRAVSAETVQTLCRTSTRTCVSAAIPVSVPVSTAQSQCPAADEAVEALAGRGKEMNVVVYTTPTCGYCTQAKSFLARQGVRFVEKNVATDRRAAAEMVRISGQRGVPVITVDDQVVVGFNQPRLMQLLSRARPRLGASIADASSQARRRAGIPTSGAYVGRLRRRSPADQAGLRPGDVIIALGGQPVASADDVHRLVPSLPRGRDISLTVIRDGRQRDHIVRL